MSALYTLRLTVILIVIPMVPGAAIGQAARVATPNTIQLPAFDGPDYACDGLRRVVAQREISAVNGGSDVTLYDQGGAEYRGDPAGLVGWQAQSLITVAGKLTILPCKAEGGPAPIVVEGNRVRFRVDDSHRLVYLDGVGSISQGKVVTKLTKAMTAPKSAAASVELEPKIPRNATLQTSKHFLLLEEDASPGSGARHVMVLRHSLIESMTQKDPASTYEQTAAEVAGILYAARDPQGVEQSVLAAAGKKVAAMATVRRFAQASELLASVGVPDGWNEAIVAVTWRGNVVGTSVSTPANTPTPAPPPSVASTAPAKGGSTQAQSFFSGSSATNIVEGQGTDFIQKADGTWQVLTGDVLTAKTADSIVVGTSTLTVTADTRVCARDGKRIALKDIPIGEKVLAINARGDQRALTIRIGVMQSKFSEPGNLSRIDNYSCL